MAALNALSKSLGPASGLRKLMTTENPEAWSRYSWRVVFGPLDRLALRVASFRTSPGGASGRRPRARASP